MDDYIIVKVENNHEEFTTKVNTLLEEGYDLNGPLNVIESKKNDDIIYIQGLYFEEEYLEEMDEEMDEEDDVMYYEVGEKSN